MVQVSSRSWVSRSATAVSVSLVLVGGAGAAGAAPLPDPRAWTSSQVASVTALAPPAQAAVTLYRAQAEAFLRSLPGGDAATIRWGDPHGHLGGVWIPGSSTIILNPAQLDGNLPLTQDVLRHEIAHVHQNRTMAATGMPLPAYEARLDAIFDGQGVERSADAVAVLLGARTVRYQSTFTPAQLAAARAILADRVP